MKSTLTIAAMTLALLAASATHADAQMQWTNKGFVNVTFGAQAPSQELQSANNFDIGYTEPVILSTTQDVAGGIFFDISGGYKVWRNLAVGVGLSRVGSDADLVIDAEVPDPDFFDSPRHVSTTASGASHSQTAIHLTGTWMMPVTDKVDVGFQFGPTIFMVSQDLPTSVTVTEPAPTVTTQVTSVDSTTMGIHFGVDVTYLVTPRIGAGVLARYTWGSVDLEGATDGLTVGGFQIGGGVRVRF